MTDLRARAREMAAEHLRRSFCADGTNSPMHIELTELLLQFAREALVAEPDDAMQEAGRIHDFRSSECRAVWTFMAKHRASELTPTGSDAPHPAEGGRQG